MTDKEIEKLYKDQLDQHFLNFLEEEKEEISKLNSTLIGSLFNVKYFNYREFKKKR